MSPLTKTFASHVTPQDAVKKVSHAFKIKRKSFCTRNRHTPDANGIQSSSAGTCFTDTSSFSEKNPNVS